MAEENLQRETRSAANKRIAKNTIALYARMVFAMLVSLYTSRVVLQTLGVDDFGTNGIVAGIVILFSFVNNTLVGSIQRFLNFELGRLNDKGVTNVFSNGFHVQVIFSIIVVLLAETIGLYYLNHYLNVPDGRLYAANWVYQFSIFVTVLRILSSPFTASVVAYERMTVFAIIGIVDVCLKLLIVYLLLISPFDRLITYAALGACVTLGITLFYVYYNQTRFKLCRIHSEIDRPLLRQMLSFSGWTIFGSVSLLATFQGVDLIINFFHGVAVNAALTIANQVYGAAYSLTSNFQTAFNPQITKTYASGDMTDLYDLVYRTTRYSFFLVIICVIPLSFQSGNLLDLWLGTVPHYAKEFCNLMMMICIIDALAAPLWMSAYARGNIRNYQIVVSCILFLNFPITAGCMAIGMSPVVALIIRFIITAIGYCYRIIYMKTTLHMPLTKYLSKAIKPCVFVFIPAILVALALHYSVSFHTIIMTTILVLTTGTAVLIFGLQHSERLALRTALKNKFIK